MTESEAGATIQEAGEAKKAFGTVVIVNQSGPVGSLLQSVFRPQADAVQYFPSLASYEAEQKQAEKPVHVDVLITDKTIDQKWKDEHPNALVAVLSRNVSSETEGDVVEPVPFSPSRFLDAVKTAKQKKQEEDKI